ncbi:MAG: DUF1624 domain-containing protein [Acidobacteria bacterium]|nr:DUF1624 domain-containing protein [Acidobacteriota bacterium]
MVVMVLDHTRDFVHAGALRFDPTDLTQTTLALFLTRWVTHFCAPAFVFLAGTAAYLQKARGLPRAALSRFLLTRGLWLVLLEFTVVRGGTWFNLDYSFLGVAQVIWVLGVSMVALSALVYLPLAAIAAVGLAMVALHNGLDGVRVEEWHGPGSAVPGLAARIWILLHQPGSLVPIAGAGGPIVWVVYPLVPWIGVMAAGYACGGLYTREGPRRVQWLVRLGAAFTVLFVALRLSNLYGDPHPWSAQATPFWTLLSFVNTTKYPPSLLFLLMTLGPSLLLAWLDGRGVRGGAGRALVMFGRVPLFFYLLQWPLAHAAAVGATRLAGKDTGYLFSSPPAFPATAPPDAGFPLGVVYVCWAAVIVVLFFVCRWFADVKRRNPSPLLRYL